MKFFIKLFSLIFFLSLTDSGMAKECNDSFVYAKMSKAIRPLNKKYHMSSCGIGGTWDDGFTSLELMLDRHGDKLTKDQARELIIDCAQTFISSMNKETKISPHLKNFPITFKNVSLIIINYDYSGNYVTYPYISSISLTSDSGYISYKMVDPIDHCKFVSRETESYDEALNILNKKKNF